MEATKQKQDPALVCWSCFQCRVLEALQEEVGVPILEAIDRYGALLREHFGDEFFGDRPTRS